MGLMNLPVLMLLKPILQHVSELLPLPEVEGASGIYCLLQSQQVLHLGGEYSSSQC